MRKTVIFGGTLMLLLFASYMIHFLLLSTPEHALAEVAMALRRHDLDAFQSHVDVESIADRMLNDAVVITEKTNAFVDPWDRPRAVPDPGVIALLRPNLSIVARQDVARIVETGKFEILCQTTATGAPKFSLGIACQQAAIDTSSLHGVAYIRIEGKIAYVGLSVYQPKYDTTVVFELKMRSRGRQWQIAEFSNFTEYCLTLNSLESRRVDAANDSILSRMNDVVRVQGVRTTKKGIWLWANEKIRVEVVVKNLSDETINGLNASVHLMPNVWGSKFCQVGEIYQQDSWFPQGWSMGERGIGRVPRAARTFLMNVRFPNQLPPHAIRTGISEYPIGASSSPREEWLTLVPSDRYLWTFVLLRNVEFQPAGPDLRLETKHLIWFFN